MSYEDNFDVGFQSERKPLAAGIYGDGINPGLEIVSYVAPKEPTSTDPDKYQHGWLTVSTNGAEGQAFLNINLKSVWLTPEAVSLAFNKGNPVDGTTAEKVATFRQMLLEQAAARAATNNTPEEAMEQATQTAFDKQLAEIKINVGTIYRLQDWKGIQRDRTAPLASLVGTEFSGVVEAGQKQSARVSSVYSRKKAKQ